MLPPPDTEGRTPEAVNIEVTACWAEELDGGWVEVAAPKDPEVKPTPPVIPVYNTSGNSKHARMKKITLCAGTSRQPAVEGIVEEIAEAVAKSAEGSRSSLGVASERRT